jgi:subtilisin family serine protease
VEPARGTLDDYVVPVGLRTIRAPQAWSAGVTGAGILLANFDSGVNGSHPSLAGRWRGSYGVPASQCWLDLAGTTTTPTDAAGHGTQTMSILCGMTAGDTLGVAWACPLHCRPPEFVLRRDLGLHRLAGFPMGR